MQNRNIDYDLVLAPYHLDPSFPVFSGGCDTISDAQPSYLHRHDCLEIGWCIEGHGVFIVDEQVLPFRSGDVCVIDHTQYHIARSAADTLSKWYFVLLDPVFFAPAIGAGEFSILRPGVSMPGVLHGSQCSGIRRLMEELVVEMQRKESGYDEVVRALLAAVLTRVERTLPSQARAHPTAPGRIALIVPALRHIAERYGDTVSVSKLADLCSVSEVYLRKLFREAVGRSPQEYIAGLRMKMAAVLLSNSTHSVTRVAQEVGYDTISSFNRRFLRAYGMSPREWRKRSTDAHMRR